MVPLNHTVVTNLLMDDRNYHIFHGPLVSIGILTDPGRYIILLYLLMKLREVMQLG